MTTKPRTYYDSFSQGYDRGRDRGYHALIDDIEATAVAELAAGKTALDAGCGTGLVMARLKERDVDVVGIDLSKGMLQKAHSRRLPVAQASLLELPFPDETFHVVSSFKVLAHVPLIRSALAELARVTKRDGFIVVDFYNTRSLRWLIRKLRSPMATSERFTEEAVFTRFDDLSEVVGYAPRDLELAGLRGARILTIVPQLLKAPIVGSLLTRWERALSASRLARFGGFLIAIFQKK